MRSVRLMEEWLRTRDQLVELVGWGVGVAARMEGEEWSGEMQGIQGRTSGMEKLKGRLK